MTRAIVLMTWICARSMLFESARTFFFAGVLPFLGFASLAAVLVKAWHDLSQPDFNYSKPLLGIQVPIVIGIGGLPLGGALMLWAWTRYRGFFAAGRRPPSPMRWSRPPAGRGLAQ